MSKLPIKDTSVRITPSAAFLKIIAKHFPCDSLTAEEIKHACKNKLRKYTKTGANPEDESVRLTALEQKFLEERKIKNTEEWRIFDKNDGQFIDNDRSEMFVKSKDSNTLTLSLVDLKLLFRALSIARKEDETTPYLHELMKDSEIILPENEILQRNPILEARCQKLRKEQEAKEYQAMTRDVDNVRKLAPQDTISFQMKQINKQLIAVAQFIFSVAAGFAFGFIGVELIIGQLDFGFRLLLGIMIALVIALAEIYFLAKKLNEEYDASMPQNVPAYSDIENRKVVESIRITANYTASKTEKVHKD
ncbi:transmembrane protein 199 [Toxorhynchites rutilus septentrionalis]|uniref:transmembrane protein 199 n=1 Tax=Toxorhynchites rutilus septentrionalis TaxID=329112 RepID=UPI002479E0AE|nr:transmembrane protein 199 [Toxorhynchites rutilus septentrionalis]